MRCFHKYFEILIFANNYAFYFSVEKRNFVNLAFDDFFLFLFTFIFFYKTKYVTKFFGCSPTTMSKIVRECYQRYRIWDLVSDVKVKYG